MEPEGFQGSDSALMLSRRTPVTVCLSEPIECPAPRVTLTWTAGLWL